jgi:hypothetical protein
MYNISSSLASQTINKNTAWKCLVALGKVCGEITPEIANRMIVEGWGVGVRVVIKRLKAVGLNVIRKSERLFLVDSFQDPSDKHVVNAQPDGLTCSCMKFKCLKNRMHKEAPQLLKALGQITLIDGSKLCVTEIYDTQTRTLEEKIHIQCHHIRAVMKQFNAFTSLEYSLNWKRVIKSYKPHSDDWMSNEQWASELGMLPELGEFKRKTK